MSSEVDQQFMRQALVLAHKALYTATPNPRVGCVIVRDGRVLGSGWTQPYGGHHAEQHALASCTEDPAGATVYVTLEPCNHVGASGRAESCVESLLRARVGRVVVATTDPNPRMVAESAAASRSAGATAPAQALDALRREGVTTSVQSLEALRREGVIVDVGACAMEARELNLGFISRMTRGRPWVRVKMAASLDGRTALADGASQWITGPEARADGHAWRARACAVLTGIGTVLQDDPQLTVRAVETPRQPRRVIVDRHAQTPHTASILRGDPKHGGQTPPAEQIPQGGSTRHAQTPAASLQADPVWIFTADPPPVPFPPHVEAISVPDARGKVDLLAMLDELGRRRINELHVEAGAKLAGTLIAQGLVDELLLYFAPCLLGDTARGMFGLPALAGLDARIPLEIREWTRLGDDWRVIARIKSGSDHV